MYTTVARVARVGSFQSNDKEPIIESNTTAPRKNSKNNISSPPQKNSKNNISSPPRRASGQYIELIHVMVIHVFLYTNVARVGSKEPIIESNTAPRKNSKEPDTDSDKKETIPASL